MQLILAFLVLFTAGAFQPAAANPDFDLGPAVGAKAPDIGSLMDQHNKPESLSALMGEKGLVVLFYRSAGWCPYCQAQLMDLNSGVSDIAKRGYKLVGISYDAPEVLAAFTEKRSITYPLLSDPGSKIIDLYGLRDPQYPPGHFAHGVPRPIIFILDRDGTIKSKLYEDTYKKRPPVGLVVETLDKLASASK